MRFDPDKVTRRRMTLGYSQETLAELSNVSARTVQRAERGEALRRDNMADIAAALKVPVHSLLAAQEGEETASSAADRITLRRASGAREIFDLIDGSRLCKLECEADPTGETMPALREAIRLIEPWLPDPWNDRPVFSSLVDRLESVASLDGAMSKLAEFGLAIFIGRRVELAVMPREYDEGYSIARNQRPELVPAARIAIAASTSDKRFVDATTQWPVEVVAQPAEAADEPA